ncbi:PAS domain-containing sensor histidine kinase [Clostridium sp. SHJSY1]|uniref:PAS domain-containing sensor histidine kinase n=1 Tax=Clostridium sp. SHJSY1 TaxID=2942483 RepID=UPI0028745F96|nr:PAS domain-containing sensor histidine kinase [Clostridium sp. SHJSY1]MDS0526263.1 PAS domain-containing sensor histidine kinase [Clostridium sp. SHJSY1]
MDNLINELKKNELLKKGLEVEDREYIDKIKRINEELRKSNIDLENKLREKTKQLEEITVELKDFNIMLEEEINERTKSEEALKERERQFRYAVEDAPVPIMLYYDDGRIVTVSKNWVNITGYTSEDIETKDHLEKISKPFKGIFGDNSERKKHSGEVFIKTKDGSMKIWDCYLANIGKMKNEHKLLMIVAIDITQRKHMEELQKNVEEERKRLYEIKEYDRIKTEFFSNISHELRTPINVVFSALQLHELRLKNCKCENASTYMNKYTHIMKQNCYRLLRLTNNLIDITKIDSGYLDLNEVNVNIISTVEDITSSVAEYIENKGLLLIFDTDTEEKIIGCDPEKIERIILNLLSNAVKFTPKGGKIMVSIETSDESVCIKVKDTGRGIPEAKVNSIFERFIQVDKSLARDHEGSGIGLSLVKCLVELHGGRISAKSKENYGTIFIIKLPCKLVQGKALEENEQCNNKSERYIEKINIEFSDIYN